MVQLLLWAENNPILTAAGLLSRANAVFNPSAARVGEETVLLLRVQDLRRISHGLGGAGQARALYPLFNDELLGLIRRLVPAERHDRIARSVFVRGRKPAPNESLPGRARG